MADEAGAGRPTVRERVAYRVDRLLARGSAGPLLWLGAATAFLTFAGALLFTALGMRWGDRQGFGESFWQSFVIAIGKGTIDEQSWTHRVASTLFIFLALFLAGSLVGLLVSAINRRLDLIRRGRSRVLERDHTLLLGASPRLDAVLDELLADPDDRRPVVVLSQEDKIEMEDRLLARHRSPRRSAIFRTGTPARRSDLDVVGIATARSVIVLNSGRSSVDAVAVRRALAADRFSPDDVHVVAEMRNGRVARSLRRSSQGRIATVCIDAAVADMLAQAVRSPGLAAVFEELLSFAGSELYLGDGAELAGTTWSDLGRTLAGVIPIGIWSDGEVDLAPNAERTVTSDDAVLVLADDPKFSLTAPDGEARATKALRQKSADPSRIMVLGWSSIGHEMIRELADHLPATAEFVVLADHDLLGVGVAAPEVGQMLEWRHTKHDPDDVSAAIENHRPDVVVVLGYQGAVDPEEADALTLLTLRTLHQYPGDHEYRVVAQLLNNELGDLAEGALGNDSANEDVVVTDAVVSRLLVHTARDRRLAGVFDELFDAAGPTVGRLPAQAGTWNGRGLQLEVAAMGKVLIGIDTADGVRLNPDFDAPIRLAEGDHVIVLSPRSPAAEPSSDEPAT